MVPGYRHGPSTISQPFRSSAPSTHPRSKSPRRAFSVFARSRSWDCRAASYRLAASPDGMTMTPSRSPRMMSPGSTLWPQHTTGTLISPGPSRYGPPGVNPEAYTGSGKPRRQSASRIGPSTTIPASLLDAAYRNMSSPIRERPDSPPDTMSTSPSSAMLRALWIIRLSPGRAFTVKATPDMVPTGSESRRTSGVMAHIRCMASATGAVANAP